MYGENAPGSTPYQKLGVTPNGGGKQDLGGAGSCPSWPVCPAWFLFVRHQAWSSSFLNPSFLVCREWFNGIEEIALP